MSFSAANSSANSTLLNASPIYDLPRVLVVNDSSVNIATVNTNTGNEYSYFGTADALPLLYRGLLVAVFASDGASLFVITNVAPASPANVFALKLYDLV